MNQTEVMNRPRVWPSLVVGLGVLAVAGIVSNLALYIVISPTLLPGQEFGAEVIDAWMAQNMATPAGFFSIVIPIHLSILVLAIAAATRSRTPFAERLGLVRGTAPLWHYPILMLGTLGAAAIGGWLFLAHISPGEDEMAMARAFAEVRGLAGVSFMIYATTVATFAEELVLRGFVLRGLLRRWKPIYAVIFSAVLFALIHPSPFFMLNALPHGIWFGIIVWRTRSIWPAIACHSFINIALAILNRWYPEPTMAFFGELTAWPIGLGVFGVIMMGVSIRLLFRSR